LQLAIKVFLVYIFKHSDQDDLIFSVISKTFRSMAGKNRVGVTFLADSNSWNVNGTPNLRTARQMHRALSQLASDDVLAQPGILLFKLGY